MKVLKSLNNSLILCLDSNGAEVILMGKGLGFQLTKGDRVPLDKVEKTFILDSLSQSVKNDYIHLFEKVSDELILSVKKIIDYANTQFDSPLSRNLFFTLVDHLKYAIERNKNGIIFQNKLLVEIQKYYPKEFAIGLYGIDVVNKALDIELPEEEAGNIAFHIVNGHDEQTNMEETIQYIRMLKDILMLLDYLFPEKEVEKESMLYLRFVTHLQFFLNRMLKGEELPNKDDFLLNSVKVRLVKEYEAAKKIKDYIEEELPVSVNNDEVLYLTLHISRIY
ncbi:beta-glucoside operon transcriptional antiterminator [Enterococcus sp. AZ194]|uniref:PRD domain-containing protein n=1 Tax=Enterococcus sp. AZ194 TaxID=2774629 RepID=UPI003F1EBAF4